jgi:hypothetical protein
MCQFEDKKCDLFQNISNYIELEVGVKIEVYKVQSWERARSQLRMSFVVIVPYTKYLAGNELVSSMTKNTVSV